MRVRLILDDHTHQYINLVSCFAQLPVQADGWFSGRCGSEESPCLQLSRWRYVLIRAVGRRGQCPSPYLLLGFRLTSFSGQIFH